MSGWEYKVVPAPTKGVKGQGIKGPQGRFANAIELLMNEMARDGWEYQRAETLPSVERSGLTGSTTEWRNLLVFRRATTSDLEAFEPELLPAPVDAPIGAEAPQDAAAEDEDSADMHNDAQSVEETYENDDDEEAPDNGVEDTDDMSDVTASLKRRAMQKSDGETAD